MLYEAKRSEMEAAISIARQQLIQRQQELGEAQARRAHPAGAGVDRAVRADIFRLAGDGRPVVERVDL